MHDAALIEAVHANRAGSVASELDGELAQRVVDACRAVGGHRDEVAAEVLALLTAAGVDASRGAVEPLPQRHTIDLRVADVATAQAAADALAPAGFEPWNAWTGGARRSFERHGDLATVARTDTVTTVVRLRWRTSGEIPAWRRAVRPTPGDWRLVSLPSWAWWAYPAVRLVRQVLERIQPARRHAGSLGPFLTTPDSLLDPLLDLVALDADDRIVDLGCGDGRLPVAAARRGAVAVGVEYDVDLVDRAERRVVEAGLADTVTIVRGDARTVPLDDYDVVFAFLPVDVMADLLPAVLGRMRPGARLVLHEQHRLPPTMRPAPDRSDLVVSDDALTVAHRWSP
ncbi:MAG: class I SAM-dependent methyltransferase [Actinomycetota bacterium]